MTLASNLECICFVVNRKLGYKTKQMKKDSLEPKMCVKQLVITKKEVCNSLHLDESKVFVGMYGDLQKIGASELVLESRYLCTIRGLR